MTLTATTPARANSHGEPCPSWCVTDHVGNDQIHRTGRTEILSADRISGVRVLGADVAHPTGPDVVVHATWFDGDAILDADLFVTPEIADQLARLVDVLAHATPGQHRKIAAAIRQAAAVITETSGA